MYYPMDISEFKMVIRFVERVSDEDMENFIKDAHKNGQTNDEFMYHIADMQNYYENQVWEEYMRLCYHYLVEEEGMRETIAYEIACKEWRNMKDEVCA